MKIYSINQMVYAFIQFLYSLPISGVFCIEKRTLMSNDIFLFVVNVSIFSNNPDVLNHENVAFKGESITKSFLAIITIKPRSQGRTK